MRPILFHWRRVTIWSYPAMLYTGLVAGIAAGNVAGHALGIDAFRVWAATCILTVPSLIGARLFHVAMHWRSYRGNVRAIWDRREGGAAQYGGFAIVIPCSVPLLAALRVPLGEFWDAATFTILAAMFFARIGCLLNGCCAGLPSTSWLSMNLPNRAKVWEKRIPTQILEAGMAALLFFAAIFLLPFRPFAGALFLVMTALYCGGRLALESTRESFRGRRGVKTYAYLSFVLILFSLTILAVRWPR
jgi:phosphatidylglycerol---prolipoprotein diacylglyceryl transferase